MEHELASVDYLRFVLSLAFVVGLIGLAAVAARKLMGGQVARMGRSRRLRIIESLPLDPRHRLVMVQRDDVAHVLLLGATGDAVVETGIPLEGVEVSPAAPVKKRKALS